MANVKITEMPIAGALTGVEIVPIVQNTENVRTTIAEILDLVPATVVPEVLQMSCSDLTTALTVGANKAYARAPRAFTLTAVRASLLQASSGGVVTVDINKNGVSILSTPITIDVGEKTSVTAAVPPVISDANIADDDEITIDLDGAGTNALGLIATLIGA
jgi:hypothetical protein